MLWRSVSTFCKSEEKPSPLVAMCARRSCRMKVALSTRSIATTEGPHLKNTAETKERGSTESGSRPLFCSKAFKGLVRSFECSQECGFFVFRVTNGWRSSPAANLFRTGKVSAWLPGVDLLRGSWERLSK